MHQPQSWNLYTYVRNNPVNATDPTGRYQCSGVNAAEDCAQVVDAAVDDINTARNNLPEGSPERAALDSTSALLGTRNDGNNTNIVLTDNPDVQAHAGTRDGVTTLTLNLTNLIGPESASARNMAARAGILAGSLKAEPAGTLAHEARHGVNQQARGMPTTAGQQFAGELQAYYVQGVVHMGLGVNSMGDYWWRQTGMRSDQILRGAKSSTQRWCLTSKAPGCQ